jgi:chromosome condensin MukBEF MukE localization factor
MTESVTSLKHLRRLRLTHDVQVTKSGGFYIARFRGAANYVFGATAHEARQRLLDTPSRCVRNDKQNSEVRANRNRGNDKQ